MSSAIQSEPTEEFLISHVAISEPTTEPLSYLDTLNQKCSLETEPQMNYLDTLNK